MVDGRGGHAVDRGDGVAIGLGVVEEVLDGVSVEDSRLNAVGQLGVLLATAAVNCVTSSSINQVLEAAKKFNSPVMIQFSNGGAQFYAGKTIDSPKDTLKGCVLGSIAVSCLPTESHTFPYTHPAGG